MIESNQPQNLTAIKRLRYRLIPPKSTREYFLWQAVTTYRQKGRWAFLRFLASLFFILLRKVFLRIFAPAGPFAIRYPIEDNSQVTVFTTAALFPTYPLRKSLSSPRLRRVSVSLITTTRNEKQSAAAWLNSLASQSRLPDEVIIVDGGSDDGTVELIQDFASRSPFSLTVLSVPGANIAHGRNLAIAQAQHEFIACTDFGCQIHPDWLHHIVAPFEIDPAVQVVAGWYRVVKNHRARMLMLGPIFSEILPEYFIPSSRSLAFAKSAWEATGGYPEWLTLTGEDTLFALELKRCCIQWAFVPEAVVEWQGPPNARAYWRKVFHWSIGDGESGVSAHLYWHSLLRILLLAGTTLALALAVISAVASGKLSAWWAPVVFLLGAGIIFLLGFSGNLRSLRDLSFEFGAEIARVAGFLSGARRRVQAWARRFENVHGTFFILSGVPIDDTGGGARPTQIALELLRQGYAVVFINKFPKYESVQLQLTISHPNLFTYQLSKFRWKRFVQDFALLLKHKPLAALVEFPLDDFLPLISALRKQAGVVIYDLLDAWDTALGGQWYSPKTEAAVIASSQVLAATEASLAARLERMSDRPVALLPNAVNTSIFDPWRTYPRPPDFPAAEWTAIYIGALWGEWFDWELLAMVANHYPQAAVVVVGDYHGQCAAPPANLHFLGLKAQRDLPPYLAHADVAIIPWKVSPITQATSPLKVYEYLAMHKPVVTPELRPLQGLPGVFTTPDHAAFIAQVAGARQVALPIVEIDRFISCNNWQARVASILEEVALHLPADRMPPGHALSKDPANE